MIVDVLSSLCIILLAVAERGSRASQGELYRYCQRIRAPENALRNSFRLLKYRHGFAEIVERGVGVFVERPRVILPHHERELIIVPDNASRHGNRFAIQ